MEVTPLEINTSIEVRRTIRISILSSLASPSVVVERGSLTASASGSSLIFIFFLKKILEKNTF
ncbi:MAG: hypothetical protein ACFFCZ_03335 [Promethearchaeota archaeon]